MPDAIEAMESAFRSVHAGEAASFPLVREKIDARKAVFGVKSGADIPNSILGLKAGGYWTNNAVKGLTNHQSSTVLFNPETGQPDAFVSANYLTAMRTAAVAGLATHYLARSDAKVMGIVGAGAQAVFQVEAVLAVRPISRLLIASRTEETARRLCRQVQRMGVTDVEIVSAEDAVSGADVLTTVTPSRSPVIQRDWVRPGTHINAMGSDTRGKHELDPKILKAARVYIDDWTQVAAVGECQHGVTDWGMVEEDVTGTLGALVTRAAGARENAEDITVFDSTGMAIQDLSVARIVVDSARIRGCGCQIELDP